MTVQTTLCILLICVISPAIFALNQTNPETLPDDHSLRWISRITFYGQVPIHYYGEGFICTGNHVKPWILLTVGSCIVGRDPKLLSSHVSVDIKINLKKNDVKVLSYEIHPNRTSGKYDNDFALLIIDVPFTWIGGRHYMPDHDYSVDELKKLKLIVSEWQCDYYYGYARVSNFLPVSNDPSICVSSELLNSDNAYCVDRGVQSYAYTEMDRGDPIFYFYNGTLKELIGMYMGQNVHQAHAGHWFLKVWPIRDWVFNFMDRHPEPPPAK